MRRLLNWIIQKLGRENYQIDPSISSSRLFVLLVTKSCQLVRGLLLKITLKKSAGMVFKGRHCRILHRSLISVGRTLLLGDYVEINALSKQGVKIGNNVFLGTKCSILKNVTIGERSVVAANAVVTKDVPTYSIVAGNPVRLIKKFDFEQNKWIKPE